MIRTYRIWRNMNKSDVDADKDISIQLFQCPNYFIWFVYELHDSVEECCGLLHHLPVPRWLANWEGKWGCECSPPGTFGRDDEGCNCGGKFGDYYGDTWGDMWHWAIETPLQEFLYKHTKEGVDHQWINVSSKDFPHDFPDIAWINSEIEREKKYAAEHGGVVGVGDLPCLDYPGSSWLYKFMEWATRRWRTPLCDGTGTQGQH
ncbi:MAG: hypothetical protein WBE13_13110 [Candidatus Acidiferrum sp.]